MMASDHFSFEISLSVLNHLGRNLYRSFMTVLGEAISNSWDAEADNVWLYVDRKNNNLAIKDDGNGMTGSDFQEKFLKVGYSKRKDGTNTSKNKNRPYIGRKGIGKLALLSCAKRVSVITKTEETEYVGGVIDNSGLDDAIEDDLTPSEYLLEELDITKFAPYIENHDKGTIIYFEDIEDGIKNTIDYLKKTIALYFRFSLIDDSFCIHLEDEEITIDHLDDLAENTEFLWTLNDIVDPYVKKKLILTDSKQSKLKKPAKSFKSDLKIRGFIASTIKPSHLKIFTTDERAGIDLFVNGRLRERDILKHKSTTRVVESYLYGQIHFDSLDDDKDRFTSSREGVVADDPKFQSLLDNLQKDIIPLIFNDWDKWRIENREDGDTENTSISPKERKSLELYNVVSNDYIPEENSKKKNTIESWVDDLREDAQYNFSSYAECFISENLIRRFIEDQELELSSEALDQIEDYKKREDASKGKGNISIEIRQKASELSYLAMADLANFVDKVDKIKEAGLSRDAYEYDPIRNAIAHTARLSDKAKMKLTAVYNNIKARLKTMLNEN